MTALLGDLLAIGRQLNLNALLGGAGLTNPSVFMHADGQELQLVLKKNHYDRRAVWQTGDREWASMLGPEGRFRVDHVHARLTPRFEVIAAQPLAIPPLGLGTRRFDVADDVRIIAWNGHPHLLGSCLNVSALRAGQGWRVGGVATRVFIAAMTPGGPPACVLPAFFNDTDMDKNWVTHERSTGELALGIDMNRNIWLALASHPTAPVAMPRHDLTWGGGWSGSSNVVDTGQGYIAVLHRVIQLKPSIYRHMFVVCDRRFRVLRRSAPFTFAGQPVEFCIGLTRNPASRELIVGYGLWDDEAHLVTVAERDALALCDIGLDDPRELYSVF